MASTRYPVGSVLAVSEDEERLTGRIIGAAMEVHRVLGPGFTEPIYHEGLEHQLGIDGLAFESEVEVKVAFKGRSLGRQRLDLLVERQVVVELKAVADLSLLHKAQLRSYLKAAGLRIGLLINFEQELLQVKRVLNG